MSAMLLEKNGNQSSTKNTKNINVRYYFIKRSGRNRGRSGRKLLDVVNVGGPFHKSIARCNVQKIQGRNHEHTR